MHKGQFPIYNGTLQICVCSSSTVCVCKGRYRNSKFWVCGEDSIPFSKPACVQLQIPVYVVFTPRIRLHKYICAIRRTHKYICAIRRTPQYICAISRTHKYICAIRRTHKYICALRRTHKFICALRRTHKYICAKRRTHKYICAIRRTHKGFNGTAVNRALPSFNFIY